MSLGGPLSSFLNDSYAVLWLYFILKEMEVLLGKPLPVFSLDLPGKLVFWFITFGVFGTSLSLSHSKHLLNNYYSSYITFELKIELQLALNVIK